MRGPPAEERRRVLCAAERVWRRMARAPPVASSTAAYALGVRDVTCKLAALRSPDGWPPVHEQHWRGRTTKVRMSGRIAQTIVARHPLPLPENERFTRHPSPLATPLRREGASSTEGGASEARGKGAQTELPGQGLRSRGLLAGEWERTAGSWAGGRNGGEPQGATGPARRRGRDRDGGCAGGGRSASAASGQHLSGEGGRTAPRADGGQGCRHSASGKSEQAAATARLTGRRPSVS